MQRRKANKNVDHWKEITQECIYVSCTIDSGMDEKKAWSHYLVWSKHEYAIGVTQKKNKYKEQWHEIIVKFEDNINHTGLKLRTKLVQ